MTWRVEIVPGPSAPPDARDAAVLGAARALGLAVTDAAVRDVYFLDGALTEADVAAVVQRLLVDPVIDEARLTPVDAPPARAAGEHVLEIAPRPGTTDSRAESLVEAAHAMGVTAVARAASGRQIRVRGPREGLERLAAALANEVVEHCVIDAAMEPPFVGGQQVDATVETIALRGLDADGLLAVSKARRLSLDAAEMTAIQAWYGAQGRDPTDVELEMFAQTWSEHCVHKTFKAHITLDDDGVEREVDSLFRSCIAAATEACGSDWLRSVFVDNAGIVGFDDRWDLAFKVETHNHPSALEPFGGANTGVGGVIRDVLGVSARPIACTDVLCFGPPDRADVPPGVLHPQRIAEGVVAGVADYGNKMGIPTVNGAVLYHPGYTANPLVYCGCLGVLPRGSHPRGARAGDHVVSIGGRTGRDGLRGATFSSMTMDDTTHQIAGASVQIGHPIHEKQVMEALLQARDERLYSAVTDCGAGGLSSAVGEMAEGLGAEIQLERVPLKYTGLRPWEIWLSEAQERMVLAVPDAHWPRFQAVCAAWGVEATSLGQFVASGRLVLRYGEAVVADLDLHVLHDGIPRRRLRATWRTPPARPLALPALDLGATLLALLATPDIRSKEHIVRRYDHEVQGGTLVKPFVGPAQAGPSDAAVLRPLDVIRAGEETGPGVALSVGIRPSYCRLDPYAMAWACVDEAVRNAVAVGADPAKLALLDNFCWGNPLLPDRLGGLVRCAEGCRDAAIAYGAPYISGKDSLNNEYTGADGQRHAIPGTLLISALALVPDARRTVTMDLKKAGNAIYLVGRTRDELGGSAVAELLGLDGGTVPQPDPLTPALARALHAAMGWVRSCHDCSEGGVLVAVAEMAMAGGLGAAIGLGGVACDGEDGADDGASDAVRALSESTGRWLVEVEPHAAAAFEQALAGFAVARLGRVTTEPTLLVRGQDHDVVVKLGLDAVAQAWRGHVAG